MLSYFKNDLSLVALSLFGLGRTRAALVDETYSIYPGTKRPVFSPLNLSNRALDLAKHVSPDFPEMQVLKFNGAIILGENGWIITRGGAWASQCSWYANHEKEASFSISRREERHLEGTVLSLLTDFHPNYSHLLLDSLSRLHLFSKAGLLNQGLRVLCPFPHSKFVKDLFARLELEKTDYVFAKQNEIFTTETLFATTFPGRRRTPAPWVPPFFQSLHPNPKARFRKLFVLRKAGTRKLVNERELERLLEKYGFEAYDPTERLDVAKTFSESKIVIGTHGAALANLCFCRPETKVVEIIPSDHPYPYYWNLAESARLDYTYFVARSLKHRRSAKGPSPYDCELDLDEFADRLLPFLARGSVKD